MSLHVSTKFESKHRASVPLPNPLRRAPSMHAHVKSLGRIASSDTRPRHSRDAVATYPLSTETIDAPQTESRVDSASPCALMPVHRRELSGGAVTRVKCRDAGLPRCCVGISRTVKHRRLCLASATTRTCPSRTTRPSRIVGRRDLSPSDSEDRSGAAAEGTHSDAHLLTYAHEHVGKRACTHTHDHRHGHA
eukprot:3004849-Pleurochrysis_carterae.AAC.1